MRQLWRLSARAGRACMSIQGAVCAGFAAAWMCAAGPLSPHTHSIPCATCRQHARVSLVSM